MTRPCRPGGRGTVPSAAGPYSLGPRAPFEGRAGTLALRLVADNGSVSALVQHRERCSGGAEDVDYAFEIRAVGIEGEEKALRGCRLQR